MGMISHETRERENYGQNGLSFVMDHFTGGADGVYTQMVTSENVSFDEYIYNSPIRFTFSPKALETGTYQYHDDNFGTRIFDPDNEFNGWLEKDYLFRDNIFDFTAQEKLQFNFDNEVIVKDRLPPEYITGIIVQDEWTKDQLLAYLREKEIIQRDALGKERILSKLAEEFIHVGDLITDEMFA